MANCFNSMNRIYIEHLKLICLLHEHVFLAFWNKLIIVVHSRCVCACRYSNRESAKWADISFILVKNIIQRNPNLWWEKKKRIRCFFYCFRIGCMLSSFVIFSLVYIIIPQPEWEDEQKIDIFLLFVWFTRTTTKISKMLAHEGGVEKNTV